MRNFDLAELSALLSRKFPSTQVLEANVVHVIPGTATKLCLQLRYDEAGQRHALPERLWLKGGLQGQPESFDALYATEARFYAEIAPQLGAHCARSYFESEPGEIPLIAIEDLNARGARFGHPGDPLSLEQATQVLRLQASYHARFWDGQLKPLGWLGDSVNTFEALIEQWTSPEHWAHQFSLPRSRHAPLKWSREFVRSGLLRMIEIDKRAARCLIHGDTHIGNLFFEPSGAVGYLDWQTTMRGHWAHDVAEFLVTGLSIEQRREHERELLRTYLSALADGGAPAPDFDEAWLAYRQHLAWGYMWVLCPPELQAEPICVINAERACVALDDLDVWSLLN